MEVRVRIVGRSLRITAASAPRLNERWTERYFDVESRNALLDLVRPLAAEVPGNLARIVDAVRTLIPPHRVVQKITPRLSPLPRDPSRTPNGLYNSAVLVLSKEVRFNRGLIAELKAIRRAGDEELDRTALASFFLDGQTGKKCRSREPASVFLPGRLNDEQKEAVRAAAARDLTLVLGPPGTGKTDVGVAIAANQLLRRETLLFASRNNVAVAELQDRVNALRPGGGLINRVGGETGPRNFWHVVRTLIPAVSSGQEKHGDCPFRAEDSRRRLDTLFRESEITESMLKRVIDVSSAHVRLGEQLARALRRIGGEEAARLEALAPSADLSRTAASLERLLRELPAPGSGTLPRLLAWLRWVLYRRKAGRTVRTAAGIVGLELHSFPSDTEGWGELAERLLPRLQYLAARAGFPALESELGQLPSLDELRERRTELDEAIIAETLRLVAAAPDEALAACTAEDRRVLSELVPLIKAGEGTGLSAQTRHEIRTRLTQAFPVALRLLPLWCCTNLSLHRRIPLAAGIYDLAVIDEASQCDIPSAIPVLFRAKRCVIIGDRFQLAHVTRLPVERDNQMFADAGLGSADLLGYKYWGNSLYDLAESRVGVLGGAGRAVMLRDHFRCHEEIIRFCSDTFYPQPLRVSTSPARLCVPRGMKPGIVWTHVAGEIRPAAGGGCTSDAELRACLDELKALIRERGFGGSIGIVTPFKAQKIRLRQLIEQELTPDEISSRAVVADTVHGFQGGQRDVMIMSLVLGPDMPAGSEKFLQEGGNLFNVAVSRAAAVLHVIGNLDWASVCGIAHIRAFAAYYKGRQERLLLQARTPEPSLWEVRFRNILEEAGISTVAQHPVEGYFLDLAYLENGLRLDIEVDGDRYHLDESGRRVEEDLWRDLRLKGLGWTVLRFWVYQVRDEPSACVKRVQAVIGEHRRKQMEAEQNESTGSAVRTGHTESAAGE